VADRSDWREKETPMLKVLIAEDDLLMADMLEEVLVESGYEVCGVARTVEKAVEIGKHLKPDLAILDLQLAQGGRGTDIANSLKRQGRIGVLYATGHISAANLSSSDGEALLRKPYKPEDVVRALEIVEQIILTGGASKPFPQGFSVLARPQSISSVSELTTSRTDEFLNFSTTDYSDLIRRLRLQQTELLNFSNYALSEGNLDKVMTEAGRLCTACLGVSYCTIARFHSEDNVFVAEAAFGAHADFVGRVLKPVNEQTPFGRAFITGKPVVSEDLDQEVRFSLPSYYAEHGIISTLVVAIGSDNGKYGVLSVGSTIRRTFDVTDVSFLTGFANVLGRAIDAEKQGTSLHDVTNRLHEMISDRDRYIAAHERILAGKDRLLETSNVLARELQHRVRNNLQLVYSMLNHQLSLTTDEAGIEGLSAIAHRVMILVEIYEHLLGADLGRTIDFGAYISSLCSRFLALHTAAHPKVKLTCQPVAVNIGLDMVTTLGLVISELVTNSYAHAFPDGKGTISVSMSMDQSGDNATISFIDDGVGFVHARENKRHGIGLVKRLMEQVGGSAALRSEHGSEWTLKFPVPITPSAGASTKAGRASAN
jgi:two-component sensor histidine kinase/DNA-binding response OmpR family regulator